MKDEYCLAIRRPVGAREVEEYNAFGPWIHVVEKASDLPPRFDPYWAELAKAAHVFKVPYCVERREAFAGSDLYKQVFAIGADGLILLGVEGGSVSRRDLGYDRIAAISLVSLLLDGRLLFEESGGGSGLELGFNTVSSPLVMDLVDAVRENAAAASRAADSSSAPHSPGPDLARAPGEEDMLSVNLLAEFREREKGLSLLAYQGACVFVSPSEAAGRSLIRRLGDKLHRFYSDPVMLLEGPSELVLLRRSCDPRRRKNARSYGYVITWLPFSSLKGIRFEPRRLENSAQATVLCLSSTGCDYELYFASPPEGVLPRLEALAAFGGH
jgi:hypothetical protein